MANLPNLTIRRSRRRPRAVVPPGPAERVGSRIETIEAHGLKWINIPSPTGDDQTWLGEQYSFHPLNLEDVLSRNQRPKIDEYPDHLFIVLNFPVFDQRVGRLNAGELDVFVGPDYLITIPNQPLAPVEYLFERCRTSESVREKYMSKGSGYLLYEIVDDSIDYCFPMLRKIGNKLEVLEDEIFLEERPAEVVRDIFEVKQEVINFRKIIRPQRPVIRDLERTKQRYMAQDMEVYFDDIVDASERIWDMLENYKEVIEALEETTESLLSHKLNDVIRILTAFSVVILPLTLVASIWGMNVQVPGEGNIEAFWIVVGTMIVLLIAMMGYFRHRDWL